MPWLTRTFLRFSLLYFVSGLTIGSLILANKGLLFYPPLWRLLPVHIDLLFLGWIVQMVFGVAFWILPRFWEKPRRGNVTGAYLAFVLLNTGIWLVVIANIWPLPSSIVLVGRVMELSAIISFVASVRPRIVPRNIQL
jgi:hypothetical protein